MTVIRRYKFEKDINEPLSIIDIYDISTGNLPLRMHSIVEYENLTGSAWIGNKRFVTVTEQATINIYDLKAGAKIKTLTTDFGPIQCMKYSSDESLLITGTKYGYVAAYRIDAKKKSIECVSKMVKINESIDAIDFKFSPRENAPKRDASLKVVRPGKRKRTDSTDDSDNEEQANGIQNDQLEYLEAHDIMIYGASARNVIAWDYHRKTVQETMIIGGNVTSVLVLRNGNIAAGDSEGYLEILDHNSFTSRQKERVLDSGALCIVQNHDSSMILVGGLEPKFGLMKKNRSSESKDEYVLFEKLKEQHGHISCASFINKTDFYTCTLEGTIVKFKTDQVDGKKVLNRYVTLPDTTEKIKFSPNEVMVIYGKSLTIYKIDGSSSGEWQGHNIVHESLPEPQKSCTLRVKAFVHSAAVSEKWICYATRRKLAIHNRDNLAHPEHANEKLPACHIMELCNSSQYLFAGQDKKLYVIKLNEPNASNSQEEGTESKSKPHEIIFAYKTKGVIRQMMHHKHTNTLVVTCTGKTNHLYVFKLPQDAKRRVPANKKVECLSKVRLPELSPFFTYNSGNSKDKNIYIYSRNDQIIKCDISTEISDADALASKFSDQERIKQLPGDLNILGMLMIAQKQCIIYERDRMFKLSMEANEITNENSTYKRITKIGSSLFNKSEELLIVSAKV